MVALTELFPVFAVSLARFIVGGIFIWSGGVKLRDLDGFSLIVASYSVVPSFLYRPARLFGYIVPFFELFAGALLVIGQYPLIGLGVILASLIGYTGIELYELFWGEGKDNCGCYGTAIEIPLSWWQVMKNIILFILAAYLTVSIMLG